MKQNSPLSFDTSERDMSPLFQKTMYVVGTNLASYSEFVYSKDWMERHCVLLMLTINQLKSLLTSARQIVSLRYCLS